MPAPRDVLTDLTTGRRGPAEVPAGPRKAKLQQGYNQVAQLANAARLDKGVTKNEALQAATQVAQHLSDSTAGVADLAGSTASSANEAFRARIDANRSALAGQRDPGLAGMAPGLDKFIRAAKTQLGADYNLGSQSAAGKGVFDCSGLTQWAARKAGIYLPRTANEQMGFTQSVSRKQLQPGDLLFFWYPNDRGLSSNQASHVTIYLGNGKQIAASSGEDKVAIQSVDWGAFIGGGRIKGKR